MTILRILFDILLPFSHKIVPQHACFVVFYFVFIFCLSHTNRRILLAPFLRYCHTTHPPAWLLSLPACLPDSLFDSQSSLFIFTVHHNLGLGETQMIVWLVNCITQPTFFRNIYNYLHNGSKMKNCINIVYNNQSYKCKI